MLCCLSESRTARLIQEMEGRPDLTIEEITEMFSRYGTRFFKHLQNFGLYYSQMISVRGDLCDIRLQLGNVPYSQADPRSPLIEGLSLLNPIHVSLELADLSALVPNPMAAALLKDYWAAVQESLTKILPGEIIPALDSAYRAIANEGAKAEAANDERPAAIKEMEFIDWCVQNNLPIPQRESARTLRHRQEAEARKAAEDARFAERERDSSSWHVREMPSAD